MQKGDDFMLHKRFFAILAAAAIAASAAGCSKTKGREQSQDAPQIDPPFESAFETEAPVASNEQQVVGKVTSIEGSKITIELGELTQKKPGRNSDGNGNGNKKERSGNNNNKKKKSSGNGNNRPDNDKKERPEGFDGKEKFGGMFGYTFNATGGNATYDLSGLSEIKLENDSDDTPDTVDEIKTGDVVVIEVGKDGKATSLTVKSLSRRGNRKPSNNGSSDDDNG